MALIYKDASGTPVDLTGWCARLTWQTNKNVKQIFSTTNTDYSTYKFTIDEPNGKITLLIPASTTNSFNFKIAYYDLELESPEEIYLGGGEYVTRILFGKVSILKRFTQSNTEMSC